MTSVQSELPDATSSVKKPLLIRLPLRHSKRGFVFSDTLWLSGQHDGYPLSRLEEYRRLRVSDKSELSNGSTLRQQASIFQCYCTFGFLEAVFEESVPERTLLRVQNGKTYFTDDQFHELLSAWQVKVANVSDQHVIRQWGDRIGEALTTMHRTLFNSIVEWRDMCLHDLDMSREEVSSMLFSFAAIAETVTTYVPDVFRSSPGMKNRGWSWTFVLALVSHDSQEMSEKRWCPFNVSIISSIGVCPYGYASSREAFVREDCDGHSKCTNRGCVVNRIDPNTYKNKHINPSCDCPNITPPIQNVIRLIADGKVPVIICRPGDLKITVHSSTEVSYVAVSHVWADGLGSASEKGLPTCQLRVLTKKCRDLLPSGAFWMDSLCIPNRLDLRKKAIGLMANTYRGASATLVIDAGIRRCSRRAPLADKLLRIVTSGWMQRLWTLQEALLAKQLIFEFADGFDSIFGGLMLPSKEDVLYNVTLGLWRSVYRLAEYRSPLVDGRAFTLVDIINSLNWRSTSKAGDETLAIAGLFDIDATELAQLPIETRMKTFLLRIRTLPANIIFLPGEKQTELGFRWAPQTFMQSRESSIQGYKGDAICTPEGLSAEYASITFANVIINGTTREYFLGDLSEDVVYYVQDATRIGSGCVFNAFLVTTLPVTRQTVPCAAVEMITPDNEDPDKIVCEFRRAFYISNITITEAQRKIGRGGDTAMKLVVKCGRLKVRLM